jgi:integrase/recombinase XerD
LKQAQVLNERDKRRVLAVIAKSKYPIRNRAMFQLSWLAGMRVGEIAALNVEDVLGADLRVRDVIQLDAEQTKGGRSRSVLVNMQLQAEIGDYVRTISHEGTHPLFTSRVGKRFSPNSLCQLFGRIYNACGLDAATSHSGRRTFITDLAHKGVNVRVLAALAGHANISTTQRYIELNENVMREAVELA